jgi:signal transduction histidine kinase
MNERKRPLRILLVEDDEDDFIILRDILSEMEGWAFELDWVENRTKAAEKISQGSYDVCLMDYRLGESNGIELIETFLRRGFNGPVILLTGHGDREVDLRAMEAGAMDYLEKGQLDAQHLERSIRYSIEKTSMLNALKQSEKRRRELSVKILEAQEKERKLIARELHDGIGASLTAIKYTLESQLSSGGHGNPGKLARITDMVRKTLEETQKISTHLRPSVLDDLGLVPAVRSLCREFGEVYPGIAVETRLEDVRGNLPDILSITIYRITQEALNNISKHSHANRVRVSLCSTPRGLELCVEDNGRSLGMEDVLAGKKGRRGMGLEGMRERVELSEGNFELIARKEVGTTIRAHWPLGSAPPLPEL